MVQKISIVSAVFILIINFKINYSNGAYLNDKNSKYFGNKLQRTLRQANIGECVSPVISNGELKVLKQKTSKKINFLSLNVTCDNDYVLDPPNEYLMSCINGFWDIDDVPQCKKCIKRPESTDINDDKDSHLFCPETSRVDSNFRDCGHRIDITHQPFVVNGTLSTFAEFPWHVGIYRKDQNDTYPTYHCGGSIISTKSILTVAHCFSDAYGKLIESREYYVSAGKYHINYNSDHETTQKRKVLKTYLHSRYKGELTNYAWDIAVIIVNESFEISTVVHPVCIDWLNYFENEHLTANKYGEVAGWGKTELNLNRASSELRVLKVPFIKAEECNKLVPSTFIKYITPDKFCAGYTNGSSVCDGDSGGGLVFEKQVNGFTKYFIRGIVSVGLQKNGRCDDYKYSTYTKVSDYIDFIQECIQNKIIETTPPSTPLTKNIISDSIDNSTDESVLCETPNEEQAKCISIYDCKIFVTALQSFPTPEVIKFTKESVCGKPNERKICCGSLTNYLSIIHSNPVITKPIVHKNLNLLPTPGVCGRRTQVNQSSVFENNVAEFLDYPWITLIEFGTKKNSAGFLCAGSLINERYVLTAAHCASRIRILDSGKIFRVRLGENNVNSEVDCVDLPKGTGLLPNGRNCTDPPLNVDVENIIIHPLYNNDNRPYKHYNIALLRLANNVSYTDFIKPICLPRNGEYSVPGKQMKYVSVQINDFGETGPLKIKTFPSVITQKECMEKYKLYRTEILDSEVCVYDAEDCDGLKGGPLMSTLTNSSDIYAEGIITPGLFECNGYPSVAVKLASFMDWILDVIRP